jgi:hypothetical protein
MVKTVGGVTAQATLVTKRADGFLFAEVEGHAWLKCCC